MTDDAAPIYDDKATVRGSLDLSGAQWQAPEEPGEDGEPIEVAFVPHTDGATYVAMRHTARSAKVLVFTLAEWDAFIKGAMDREFHERW
jgi:hypothetical protein